MENKEPIIDWSLSFREFQWISYHLLPLHAPVLVPRLHLELRESERLGQVQPEEEKSDISHQFQEVTGSYCTFGFELLCILPHPK